MTNQYLTFFFNRKITIIINSFNFFKQCFYYSAAGIIIIFLFFIKKAFNDIPRNGQFYFQDPASSAMIGIIDLHHDVMFWVCFIVFFVLQILFFEIFFFGISIEKSLSIRLAEDRIFFTSCADLETVWTAIPIMILYSIAAPSISLLYTIEEEKNPQLTTKIIGHQWYWSYEISDFINYYYQNNQQNEISFDSSLEAKDKVKYARLRLFEVDNALFLPTHMNIRFLITSEDVIHSWTVPSFGIKLDAIPGRLNSAILSINRIGVFYGQCSELCGVGHGFMPICVHAVSRVSFIEWVLDFLNLKSFWSLYQIKSTKNIIEFKNPDGVLKKQA